MARLASLLAATLAAAFLASGCEKNNLGYCANHTADFCPGDSGMTEPQGCMSNTDCASGSAKVCDVGGDRTCVQCLGTGQVTDCADPAAPTCDNRMCRACRAHADCASLACLPTGVCAVEGTVAYVDSAGTDNTACSKATPCTKIQKAIDTSRAIVKLHGNLDEGVNIDRSLTVLADPGTKLTRTATGAILQVNNTVTVDINDLLLDRSANPNDPGIQANGNTTLTLNGVTVSNTKGNGITCTGKSLTVNHSTISSNDQIGVACGAGALTITASTISKNLGGGISVMNTTFDITNTFIYRNGKTDPGGSGIGGASLNTPGLGTNRFEFNTVVDNHLRNSGSLAGGVFCDTATLALPNNIIAHNDVDGDPNKTNSNTPTAGLCTYPSSAVATSVTDFNFVNATTDPYNYKISLGSVAIDKALTPSAVAVDFEGDPRPLPAGGLKDQGADEYKP